MEIVKTTSPHFLKYWEQFTTTHNVPWRYSLSVLAYQRAYSANKLLADESFLVTHNEEIVAICPLFIEQFEATPEISFGGGYSPAPLLNRQSGNSLQKKTEQFCYEAIDNVAKKNSLSRARMMLDPAISSPWNALQQYGYLEASLATTVLDLSTPSAKLHSTLRKSYKSLINKAKRNFSYVIIDYTNPSQELVEQYREMHHRAAGRVTRPLETFNLQHEGIVQDHGMLLGIQYENRFVAFSYFLHSGQSAYYGSAADEPDYSGNIPLEHSIIWAAVEYYKERGIPYFEVGTQQFGPQIFDHPSDKDLSIAFFKRGFSTQPSPLFRGIKYYSSELFEKDMRQNIHTAQTALFPAGE